MNKRSILERLFPAKYDFFDSLSRQAQINALGISALGDWLKYGKVSDGDTLERCRQEAYEIRQKLEKELVEAFSTPIDRGEIYLFSINMDKVIEYALSTLLSMKAFGVETNSTIKDMVGHLKKGVDMFLEAVKCLKDNPAKSEWFIPGMRSTHASTEQLYRNGMAVVFNSGDPMHALKLREVYHHIKDASSNLDFSVDILHRIIVELT